MWRNLGHRGSSINYVQITPHVVQWSIVNAKRTIPKHMVVMLLNSKQRKSFKRKKDISSQNSNNKIYSDCENILKNEKKIKIVSDEQS